MEVEEPESNYIFTSRVQFYYIPKGIYRLNVRTKLSTPRVVRDKSG